MAFHYFTDIFQTSHSFSHDQILDKLHQILIPTLQTSEHELLIKHILLSEVKEAVFDLPKDSATGPDGFHASFFQQNWHLVHMSIFNMLTNVWNSSHILKVINHTNVVLLPMSSHPQTFKDLRLITLSNVSYEILSKILCNRLKTILHDIIHPCQSAFL